MFRSLQNKKGQNTLEYVLMLVFVVGIVMVLFLNEEIFFYSYIPTQDFIHEGSQDLFERALKSPESEVDWVVTGVDQSSVLTDIVNKNISKISLKEHFQLKHETNYTRIYEKVEVEVADR